MSSGIAAFFVVKRAGDPDRESPSPTGFFANRSFLLAEGNFQGANGIFTFAGCGKAMRLDGEPLAAGMYNCD